MLLTRFDRDVVDSAVNLTTFFTVSSSAGIKVSRDQEQPAVPVRADKWSAPYSPNE